MSYFGVLLTFIAPPLALLAGGQVWRRLSGIPIDRRGLAAVGVHALIALLYTTPWDNYLVATGVWWYDPALVTGITLGWVPLEEYTFFVLQTLLTGLWTLVVTDNLKSQHPPVLDDPQPRRRAILSLAIVWVLAVAPLALGWRPGTYLALILVWAIPPLLVQFAFGADILRAYARPLLGSILPPTLYLWLVDTLAIGAGTWTIDPAQITGLKLGPLPLEEMLFFLASNVIIVLGITLLRAPASQERARRLLASWQAWRADQAQKHSGNGPASAGDAA